MELLNSIYFEEAAKYGNMLYSPIYKELDTANGTTITVRLNGEMFYCGDEIKNTSKEKAGYLNPFKGSVFEQSNDTIEFDPEQYVELIQELIDDKINEDDTYNLYFHYNGFKSDIFSFSDVNEVPDHIWRSFDVMDRRIISIDVDKPDAEPTPLPGRIILSNLKIHKGGKITSVNQLLKEEGFNYRNVVSDLNTYITFEKFLAPEFSQETQPTTSEDQYKLSLNILNENVDDKPFHYVHYTTSEPEIDAISKYLIIRSLIPLPYLEKFNKNRELFNAHVSAMKKL